MDNNDIKILVVDDDETNRYCGKRNLSLNGYNNFAEADDGTTCLEYLSNNPDVDIIFLDRMMNALHGVPTLKKIRENKNLDDVIIIFQTGEIAVEHIEECMNAGSLHLLKKPYEDEQMARFVNISAHLIRAKRQIQEKLKNNIEKRQIFEIKSFDDLIEITASIANNFVNPIKVYEAIYELLFNAIEHGNLGIGKNKNTLLTKDLYDDEIKKRLNLESANNIVKVKIEENEESLKLFIQDQGNGFNFDDSVKFTADKIKNYSGRGIFKAINSFDKIEFLNNGTLVVCTQNK